MLDQRICDHPLASQLPDATTIKRPTLFPSAEEFHELVTRPGHATNFPDWSDTDQPALGVHLVRFTDATLLTLSWSHVFLDALGRQRLLEAWIAVLDGREDDVPDFVSLEDDPANTIAQGGDPKQHVLYNYVLTGVWFALFVLGYVYELIMHSAETGRMVCFPGPWVDKLREEAMADALTSRQDDKNIFLSHGDILLAWWAKVFIASQNLSPSQPITIMNTTNLRGLFPDHLPDNEKTAYTTNATMQTYTFVSCSELARLSVGEIALRLRQDLQKQRTPEQARHHVAWQLESNQKYGRPPTVGPWNQIMMIWSNWHRARFYNVDFSSAVVRPGKPLESRANKIGQPSCILPNGHTNGISMRNAGPLIGRDANGNWWISSVLRSKAWAEVQEQFERL